MSIYEKYKREDIFGLNKNISKNTADIYLAGMIIFIFISFITYLILY